MGFMGAGKSTVGPLLADRLGWRFVDADHYLQAKSGSTIPEIFSTHGEGAFRRMEAEAIRELHCHREIVLALGGGALEAESTRNLLYGFADTCVVFLKASLEVMIGRCENQRNVALRPILQQRETLVDRFQSRLVHYEKANITIVTDGIDPEAVAEDILVRLTMGDRIENSKAASSKERAIAK